MRFIPEDADRAPAHSADGRRKRVPREGSRGRDSKRVVCPRVYLHMLSARRLTAIAVAAVGTLVGLYRPWKSTRAHRFVNDGVPLQPRSLAVLASPRSGKVTMEVHRVPLSSAHGKPPAVMFGAFVASGSHFEPGDLVGCFGGAVVHGEELVAKKLRVPRVDSYIYGAPRSVSLERVAFEV